MIKWFDRRPGCLALHALNIMMTFGIASNIYEDYGELLWLPIFLFWLHNFVVVELMCDA